MGRERVRESERDARAAKMKIITMQRSVAQSFANAWKPLRFTFSCVHADERPKNGQGLPGCFAPNEPIAEDVHEAPGVELDMERVVEEQKLAATTAESSKNSVHGIARG